MPRALWIAWTVALLLAGLHPSAAQAAGGEGRLINLDRSLILQAVNFLLLLFLLSKLLYRPLLAKMEERSQAIKRSLEEAQAARVEAERLVASARAELAQDTRRAREALRREAADLSIQVAERLIRRSLREDDHRRIVEDAIARLDRAS